MSFSLRLEKNTAGFSLVEVVVALALCALVLPIAMSLLSSNIGRMNYTEEKLRNSVVAACAVETAAAEYYLSLETAIPKQYQIGQAQSSIRKQKLSSGIPYLEHSNKPAPNASITSVAKYCLPPEINLNFQAQTNSASLSWQGALPSADQLKECAYSFEELKR